MTYSPVTESLWIPPSLESLVCTRSPPFCDLEYDPRWAPSRSYGSQPRHPVVNGSRLVVLVGHPPENEQRYKKPSFVPTGAIDWTVWLVVTHVYFSTLEKGGWSQLTRVFFQGWLKHQPVWCHCPVASGDAPWPQYWLWWAANGISQGEGVGPCWWGQGRSEVM